MKAQVEDAKLVADWRWQLVQRVVASQTFQKSPRLTAFLLYVSEKALDHHPEEVSEQQIGIHVFGRAAGYDSGSDNVVRSQARQLRLRLEHYFATEGAGESATVVIPKGTYLPEFAARQPEAHTLRQPDAPILPAPIAPVERIRRPLALYAVSVIAVVLAVICIWQEVELRQPANVETKTPGGAFGELWSGIFKKGQEVVAVVPDHTYETVQASAHRDIPLGEYLSQDYGAELRALAARSGLSRALPGFSDLHLTGLYAVTDIARITRMQHLYSQTLAVRWPHDISMRDLDNGNVILIGARNSNPWVELFEGNLNFDFRWDAESNYIYCVNRSPKAGELPEYRPTASGGTRVVYGGVALLPTPQRHGSALLIFGTSMAGAEIAAEYITNERLSSAWLDQRTAEAKGKLPYFEVLLKTTSIAAQAGHADVVAHRVIPE
jgi:hypothetical protein